MQMGGLGSRSGSRLVLTKRAAILEGVTVDVEALDWTLVARAPCIFVDEDATFRRRCWLSVGRIAGGPGVGVDSDRVGVSLWVLRRGVMCGVELRSSAAAAASDEVGV